MSIFFIHAKVVWGKSDSCVIEIPIQIFVINYLTRPPRCCGRFPYFSTLHPRVYKGFSPKIYPKCDRITTISISYDTSPICSISSCVCISISSSSIKGYTLIITLNIPL